MTEAQIEFIETRSQAYEDSLDELVEMFPEVDWVARDARRRACERKRHHEWLKRLTPKQREEQKRFHELSGALMRDVYLPLVRRQLETQSVLLGRLEKNR